LGFFDQKSAIAITMPIATAFKFYTVSGTEKAGSRIINRQNLGFDVFDYCYCVFHKAVTTHAAREGLGKIRYFWC
jgi:hypothetical protein